MHRRGLLELLARYRALHPGEGAVVDRIGALVRGHEDCLLRTCAPGHVTASAWVVSADGRRHLLTLHRKLGRWLQLGGHADGEGDPLAVALREVQEESGLRLLAPWPVSAPPTLPFDVDVHAIPARGDEPAHEHHDLRYLLVAAPGQRLVASEESKELRWFDDRELAAVTGEESVLRLLRKCRGLIGGASAGQR